MKLNELTKIGNAEITRVINPEGICVGNHSSADYPLTEWKSSGETTEGEKVIITYITDAVDTKIAEEHGWDMIDWKSKISRIENV